MTHNNGAHGRLYARGHDVHERREGLLTATDAALERELALAVEQENRLDVEHRTRGSGRIRDASSTLQ
jgi:hypothetical protein